MSVYEFCRLRPAQRLLSVFGLMFLATCSGFAGPNVSFDPDIDFSQYRTYSWTETGALQDLGPESLAQVRTAIEQDLAQRGFGLTEDADFTVSFSVSQLAYDRPFRARYTTRPAAEFLESPQDRAGESVVTLAISIADAATSRGLWRGSTSAALASGDAAVTVQRLVPEILAKFPPK